MRAPRATGLTVTVLLALSTVVVLSGQAHAAMVPPQDIAYLEGTAYSLDGQYGAPSHLIIHLNDGN